MTNGHIRTYPEATYPLGLGDARGIDTIEVRWPSGKTETRKNIVYGSRTRWVKGQP